MKNNFRFTKMHGLGNDFIVIFDPKFSIKNFPIQQLSHRNLGIGFDQLLVIGTSTRADFSCQIYNSDGSEAEQCGNGMRCVARYLHEEKLTDKNTITLETKAGIIKAHVHDYEQIEIDMGAPKLDPPCALTIEDQSIPLTLISMGNPHAILIVPSLTTYPVKELGPKISTHAFFPHGTNVGFMEIKNRTQIHLRTYERGAGETFACGSNACAAVVAGIQQNKLDEKVKVLLTFGELTIEWKKNKSPVLMTGPASRVFNGGD